MEFEGYEVVQMQVTGAFVSYITFSNRASKGHHSSRPNHGVGVDVPGANSKTAGSMQSAGGGSNAGRSQLSSQLSIVNESPTRVQVASKCVETDHNENRNEEHEEVSFTHSHVCWSDFQTNIVLTADNEFRATLQLEI